MFSYSWRNFFEKKLVKNIGEIIVATGIFSKWENNAFYAAVNTFLNDHFIVGIINFLYVRRSWHEVQIFCET